MKTLGWVGLGSALVVAALLFLPMKRGHAQVTAIHLLWTAPGDDGNVGTASNYEFRVSATRPDTTGYGAWQAGGALDSSVPSGLAIWWANATSKAGPIPLVAGTPSSFDLMGPFNSGRTYYVMARACDDALDVNGNPKPNCGRSNLLAVFLPDVTPPRAIIDLRAS